MSTHKRGRPRLNGRPPGTRDGPLQAHILALLADTVPGIQTLRWREKTFEAFKDSSEVEHLEEDFRKGLQDLAFIPDAFVIDREAMRLDFFEVEITSLLTASKLKAYAEFVTIMDYYGIEFSVFSVNQHGHINEVALIGHYVNLLRSRTARQDENEQ